MRKYRRRAVRRFGKRSLRGLNGFFQRQSLVGDPVVFDTGCFPFTRELERHSSAIQSECRSLLEQREKLPPLGSISLENNRIARESGWRIFMFYGFGYRSDRNCARCPQTAALLDHVPGLQNAWFSILQPRGKVPAHRGITKGLVRCHLGLVIPKEREKCFMSVAGHRVVWEEGRCVVFDDMNEHSVLNDTDEERAILLVDFHRPLRTRGALMSRAMLSLMRRTAYVRDAYRREMAWEEEFYARPSRDQSATLSP
jgi:beta-hydroxylase